MPPAFVLQIFHADFVQSNMFQWESSFLLPLYFNPVRTCPELFPCVHKVISKHFILFNMRGTSFWLLVVPTAAVWQSHSRDGVEWVVEAGKQGGAQEFWTGCEGAEQHSQRLGDSLQVSSKWSRGWDQTKPARAAPAEDALTVQRVLQGLTVSTTRPILCSFDPGPKSSFLFLLLMVLFSSHSSLPCPRLCLKCDSPTSSCFLLWDTSHLVPLSLLTRHQTPERTLHMPCVKMRNWWYIPVLGWKWLWEMLSWMLRGLCPLLVQSFHSDSGWRARTEVPKIPLSVRGQWPQESAAGDSEAVWRLSRNTNH